MARSELRAYSLWAYRMLFVIPVVILTIAAAIYNGDSFLWILCAIEVVFFGWALYFFLYREVSKRVYIEDGQIYFSTPTAKVTEYVSDITDVDIRYWERHLFKRGHVLLTVTFNGDEKVSVDYGQSEKYQVFAKTAQKVANFFDENHIDNRVTKMQYEKKTDN